jgi:hypothetical protein
MDAFDFGLAVVVLFILVHIDTTLGKIYDLLVLLPK